MVHRNYPGDRRHCTPAGEFAPEERHMDNIRERVPPPEDPGRRREIRRRGASYARSVGNAKRQRAAIRASELEVGNSLRRIYQVLSATEADQFPGPPQWIQEYIEAMARQHGTDPWPILAGMMVTTAEVECEALGGCRRRLWQEASEWETRHQGMTDVLQVVLADRWSRDGLEQLVDSGSRHLAGLVRMLGVALVALREGV